MSMTEDGLMDDTAERRLACRRISSYWNSVGKVCRFYHSYEEVEGVNVLSILSRTTIRRKSRRFPTDTNFYHVFLCTIISYMMTGVMRGEIKRGDDDDGDDVATTKLGVAASVRRR